MRRTPFILPLVAALGGLSDLKTFEPPPKTDKPQFTNEELDELRALPRREQKKRVRELRLKYAKLKGLP